MMYWLKWPLRKKKKKTASRNSLRWQLERAQSAHDDRIGAFKTLTLTRLHKFLLGGRSDDLPRWSCHLQTPSCGSALVAYSWTKDSAIEAFEAALPQAKELAQGEDISERLVGSAVSDAAKE